MSLVGTIEEVYIGSEGGAEMQLVDEVRALADCGLEGDRYCKGVGSWTGTDECQVTLIALEDLEQIANTTGIHVIRGEHRRNLITRGVQLENLDGKRFLVGQAVLEYEKPRPPCSYIQSITEPGMTKALAGHSGICARVIESGLIRAGDSIHLTAAEEESRIQNSGR
jgi:MOSC domain-containing protein YiiM